MRDIQELINSIISKVKVANISDETENSTTTYYSEPILKTASELIVNLPNKYREMRKIRNTSNYYYERDVKTFYDQGKFMEAYEDDFEYLGEFNRYFPTYEAMNDNQLRGYFSWRSKVRRGEITMTSLSFVFVYIYELLNQIGATSALDGYNKLFSFWQAYKSIESRIDSYMNLWLKDYIIYYDLDLSLLSNHLSLQNDNNLEILLHYTNHSPKEVTEALSYFSNYNLLKSKFYIQYSEDMETVVYNVYSALIEYYKNNRKNSIFTKFFGILSYEPYYMFNSAIFYKKEKLEDKIYNINSVNRFFVKNGAWYQEHYPKLKRRNKDIGEVLKIIDSVMRQMYSFKTAISIENTTKLYLNIIEKTVNEFCVDNGKLNLYLLSMRSVKKKLSEIEAQPAPVVIDTTKFSEIRAVSLEIQNKLIVDEEQDINTEDFQVIKVHKQDVQEMKVQKQDVQVTVVQAQDSILTPSECQILKAIMEENKSKYTDLLKTKGQLLSVFVDEINEKLFEAFNDNCIEFHGDTPIIIEDYLDDVKGLLKI